MNGKFAESAVEDASLSRHGQLNHLLLHGQGMAPGEPLSGVQVKNLDPRPIWWHLL
jgi:hypothetical protein